MRIVTLAPDFDLDRLRVASAPDTIVAAANGDAALRSVSEGGIRWAILDPLSVSERQFRLICDAAVGGGVRLALFMAADRFSFGRLMALPSGVIPELAFRYVDSDWRYLVGIFSLKEESVRARVLAQLLPHIQSLHARIRMRVVAMFSRNELPRSIASFCAEAEVSEDLVRRQLASARLASPKHLLSAARAARAFEDLAERRRTIEFIASAHGFGSLRSFERTHKVFAGVPPRSIYGRLGPEAFSTMIFDAIVLRS